MAQPDGSGGDAPTAAGAPTTAALETAAPTAAADDTCGSVNITSATKGDVFYLDGKWQ
jgi:hypothetical protein